MENNQDSLRLMQLEALCEAFVEEAQRLGSGAIVLSVLDSSGGDNARAAAHISGNSTHVCSMLLALLIRLSPDDFDSIRRLLNESPFMEQLRKPRKIGMVN